jgi:hypothetical protein
MTIAKDAEMMINARIAQIDHLLSFQLNEIMHNAAFQKLEGAWRGLKYLMDQSETGVNAEDQGPERSKKELLKDLQRAPEFDQSALFKKVYEEEYGVFGGAPFGGAGRRLRIRQTSRRHRTAGEDLQRGCGAHAPFCHAAAPDLFNLPSYTSLDAPRDLAKIFDTTEYAKWKSFRADRGLPLRGDVPSPHPGPSALRQRHQAGGSLQLRRARGWHRPLQVSVDECRVCARHPHDQLVSLNTGCALPCAEWKAAAWWKACRSTTSIPTKAMWR